MGVWELAPNMRNKITEKWVWGLAPDMRNKITEMGTAKVKQFCKNDHSADLIISTDSYTTTYDPTLWSYELFSC